MLNLRIKGVILSLEVKTALMWRKFCRNLSFTAVNIIFNSLCFS